MEAFDTTWVLACNEAANASGALKAWAQFFSHRMLLWPLGILLPLFAFSFKSPRLWHVFWGLVLATLLTDPLCHQVLKPFFARARPCQTLEAIAALEKCGTGFSLPSNHAANGMSLALAALLLWRPQLKIGLPVLAFGMCVGLSRVFVGVHYPSDVLLGWLVGGVCGAVAAWIVRWNVHGASANQEGIRQIDREPTTGAEIGHNLVANRYSLGRVQ